MAAEADWFRAFVELALQQAWGLPQVVRDADGDYAFGEDEAMAWVSVESAAGLGVCVWSYAAQRVKGSLGVLREVNELNMGSRLCKVTWSAGLIRVELRLPADQVSAASLARACEHVEGVTSDIGQMFAVVHGGENALARPRAS
jgi:hypothetical protein